MSSGIHLWNTTSEYFRVLDTRSSVLSTSVPSSSQVVTTGTCRTSQDARAISALMMFSMLW